MIKLDSHGASWRDVSANEEMVSLRNRAKRLNANVIGWGFGIRIIVYKDNYYAFYNDEYIAWHLSSDWIKDYPQIRELLPPKWDIKFRNKK